MITAASLKQFFPRGKAAWLTALEALAPELCQTHGVTTTQRWCHLMAQIAAETDGLALAHMRESLAYRPTRILEVFEYRVRKAQKSHPRFKDEPLIEIAAAMAADQELLAETVYGDRKELGNVEPGDGARYIGRGPLQTTGREWYAKLGAAIGVDLLGHPELLETPEIGWRATFAEWEILGANALADRDSVDAVSRKVNGGTNGLARRKREYARAVTIWPDQDEPIGAPMVPRRADATPAPVTPATIAADGSRSMSWLQQLKLWLVGGNAAIAAFFGADTFGGFKGTLNEIKSLVTDHAMVLTLVGLALVTGVVLLVQHYIVQAVRDGRYTPAKD